MTFLHPDEILKRYKPSKTEVKTYISKHHLRGTSKVRRRVRDILAARKAAMEPGRAYSIKQTIAPWQIVYGKARVPGVFAFLHLIANNLNLNQVILIAGHEIESIERVFLDTDEVIFGGSPDPRWSTFFKAADGTTRAANYKVFMAPILGAPGQSAQGDLIGQCPDKWTSAHTLSNHAGAYLIFVWDAILFPDGQPDIHFEVKGKKCYDPRSTLTVWTSNAALIAADFLMDTKIGFGVPFAKIDMVALAAAANTCGEAVTLQDGTTETRYNINGYFDSSDDRNQILEQMVQAMAGTITYCGGLWKIKAGVYTSPVLTLTDDDWLSSLNIQMKPSRSENFNAIKGTYVAADRNWEEREFPMVKNDFYKAQDNQERVIEDVQFPFTISPATAQRLSKIELEKVRQAITIEGTATLKAYQAEVGDIVQVTRARLGWTNKLFEVIESEVVVEQDDTGAPHIGVDLMLKETAAGIWNWNNGEETMVDLSPNTNLPSPFYVLPPSGITLESGTDQLYLRSDGTVFSRIKVSWTHVVDAYVNSGGRIEVQYKRHSDVNWSNASSVPGDQDFLHILDVQDSVNYDVRVRAVNAAQITSAYTSTYQHVVVGKTEPPSNVSQLAGSISGFSIQLTWPAVPDLDIAHYLLKIGAPGDTWSQAQVVAEVRGTAYTYQLQSANTYRFQIKAVDTSGNQSAEATVINVAVAAPSAVDITQTILGPDVVLAWTEATGNFAIAQYEISFGSTYETSSPLAIVMGTTHTRKVDWGDVRRFWVAARDVAGNLGSGRSIDVTIVPPSGVQSLSSTPIDNNVKLTWEAPTFGSLPLDRYEIRKGNVYPTSVMVGEVKGTISVIPELTGGTFTYWITPVDSAENVGPERGATAVVSAPPNYQLLDDQLLDPTSGTYNNIVIQDAVYVVSTVVVNPTEIQDLIANPGMGLQTTRKSLAELNAELPQKNPLNLPSQDEVVRLLWAEMHPGNGSYDFAALDTFVRNARASNQTTCFRIIACDEANVLSGSWWLQAFAGVAGSGTPGWIYKALDDGGTTDQYTPDFSNAVVQSKFHDFCVALSTHTIDGIPFNQHPNLAVVDASVWGLYGENHFSGAMISPAYSVQVPEPSQATQQWIVDEVFAAFPEKKKVACVDALFTLDYEVNTKGGGWRADGLGNPWHMNTLYPNRISQANLGEAWRNAVVTFEPYLTMVQWVSNGWDVAGILNWMLARGIMSFNSKNTFNPPASVTNVFIDFIRKMGYRHVLKSLEHNQTITVGSSSDFKVQWKNAGVAKSHFGHLLALKFSKANGPSYIAKGVEANFLPGDSALTQAVVLPTHLTAGQYSLSVGVIDPNTRKPDVKLAISGRDSTGWYPVSTIEVVNPSPVFSPLKFPSVGIYGAYYTAEAGTIKTQSGQVAATWNDVLEEWQDQSGNGRHWEQLASGKKPQLLQTTINSLPGILWDGSDDHFLANRWLKKIISNAARLKIFMVMRCLTQNNNNHVLSFGGRARMLDTGTAPTMNYNIGGRRLDADSFVSQSSVVTHGNNVTQLRTIDFNWGQANASLFVNGSKGTAIVSIPSWLTAGRTSDVDIAMGLGAASTGVADFTNMWVSSLIFAVQEKADDPFLSTADTNEIESALATKYGITIAP